MKKVLWGLVGIGTLGFFFLNAFTSYGINPTRIEFGGTGTSTIFSTNSLILQGSTVPGSAGYKGVATGTNGSVLQMVANTPTWSTGYNNTNWDTAYTQTQQWNGGSTNLVAATGRTSLGLGTIVTQNSNNVSITGGVISGITDLAIADGGTGISTAPTVSGQLLMSNSSTWQIGNLVAGTNITITTSTPGQITIASSGGGSGNSAWTIGNGVIYNATSTNLIGIGTSSPQGNLHIYSSTNPYLILTNSSATTTAKSLYITNDINNSFSMGEFNDAFTATTSYITMIPKGLISIGIGAGPDLKNSNFSTSTGAVENVYLGFLAGASSTVAGVGINTGAYGLTAIGAEALQLNTGGSEQTAVGTGALGKIAGNSNQNVAVGFTAGGSLTNGSNNVFIGNDAGNVTLSATGDTVVGSGALFQNNQTHSFNTVVGQNAYVNGSTGGNNTIMGARAFSNSGGSNNIVIGFQANKDGTSGDNNIMLGYSIDFPTNTGSNMLDIGNLLYGTNLTTFSQASPSNLISAGQIGIGTSTPIAKFTVMASTTDATIPAFVVASSSGVTMFKVDNNASTTITNLTITGNCTGCGTGTPGGTVNQLQYNNGSGGFGGSTITIKDASDVNKQDVFIGYQSGASYTSGGFNVALGSYTLTALTSGAHNTAVGNQTMETLTTGTLNTAIGNTALDVMQSSNYNVGIGYDSGGNIDIGNEGTNNNNITIGTEAGQNLRVGAGNIIIGAFVGTTATTKSQQLNIGNLIYGSGLYNDSGSQTVTSTPVNGKVGIGTTTPTAVLTVQGFAGATTNLLTIASSTGNTYLKIDSKGHLVSGGPTPSVSSCGTGSPTVTGTDDQGTITLGGTAPTACTLTFSQARTNNYSCQVGDNSLTIASDVSATSTTAVTFGLGVGGLAGGNLFYHCEEFTNGN
jgi:hypothetical protein